VKEVKGIETNLQVKTGNRIILFTGDGKGKTTAAPGLMALADTVTEMRLVKHGLTAGWPAQQGVEY